MKKNNFSERLKNTGRNDTCPCGSGKKYKKCHLSEDTLAQQKEAQEQIETAASDDDANDAPDTQASNTTHFTNAVKSKLKKGKTVARRNAPRRQAGK